MSDTVPDDSDDGAGWAVWANTISAVKRLGEQVARPHSGRSGNDCACTAAGATAVSSCAYPTHAGGTSRRWCDFNADGGDIPARIGQWHTVLPRAIRREPLDGGVALTLPHDPDLTPSAGWPPPTTAAAASAATTCASTNAAPGGRCAPQRRPERPRRHVRHPD